MDNQRLSSSASGATGSLHYTVDTPGDPAKPTDFAVVVGWNHAVSYEADEGKWADELAQPLWGLIKDAVNHPPSFEQETNFDPQVAGEMQQDAFLALAFSVIAIMIYIWVRFGNLKYGTATVVALLHDTVFTLAALGFAHYIAECWHQQFPADRAVPHQSDGGGRHPDDHGIFDDRHDRRVRPHPREPRPIRAPQPGRSSTTRSTRPCRAPF